MSSIHRNQMIGIWKSSMLSNETAEFMNVCIFNFNLTNFTTAFFATQNCPLFMNRTILSWTEIFLLEFTLNISKDFFIFLLLLIVFFNYFQVKWIQNQKSIWQYIWKLQVVVLFDCITDISVQKTNIQFI